MIILVTGYLDYPSTPQKVKELTERVQNTGGTIHSHPLNTKHPKIQYEWIYRVADNKANDLIFTNSDHILNGLLVAIKDKKIDREEVEIYYIDEEGICDLIPIQDGGKIKKSPKGFFDQIGIAVMKLLS